MRLDFDYKSVVKTSEKVEWILDEIFPEGTKLQFARFFLPPSLVPAVELTFLSDAEQLTRNHVTSNAYMNLFGFVEEYIIAMALQHAQAEIFGNRDAIRALSRFADVAGVILSKSPLAVMLVTFHLELITQQHYVDSIKDNARIDPFFASLLKN